MNAADLLLQNEKVTEYAKKFYHNQVYSKNA